MRKAIPVEQRVAIALWRLATTTDYRTIGHLFGVSKPAVCGIVCHRTTANATIYQNSFW